MADFQVSMYADPNTLPKGIEGDPCDANVYTTVDAGPWQIVAGAAGVYQGRFAWLDPSGTLANSFGAGPPDGFVRRDMTGLITGYLSLSGMLIRSGMAVTLCNSGGFWVRNSGTNQVLRGMKAYANLGTGMITFGATGSAPQAASTTAAIAASTASVTGSIIDNLLTVTAVGSGVLVVGGILTGTSVVTGTQIVRQISGTTGGIGTYQVNIPNQNVVAGTTISETYGTMTVTAVGSGALGVGQPVAGSGVTAGSSITALGTGTGGVGTYIVSPTQTATSTTITATGGVETKWYAGSIGQASELVKMTSWPNG